MGNVMPATPAMFDPDAEPLRWFTASFKGGHCRHCGEDIEEGDEMAYASDRQIVRRECCGDDPQQPELITNPRNRPSEQRVMPTGKTKRDACSRCFIIHTAGQGDDCD